MDWEFSDKGSVDVYTGSTGRLELASMLNSVDISVIHIYMITSFLLLSHIQFFDSIFLFWTEIIFALCI